MADKTYIAIDLKSFYASVECVERGLNPLAANLVVADPTRTEKTICLAVSPSLKAFGIPGRARLFEVNQRVKEVNKERLYKAPGRKFKGSSIFEHELKEDSSLSIDFVIAPPQMARYMEISTEIYNIYLKYVAPEDIHVYSVDEVFIDATAYLRLYNLSAHDFAMKLIKEVLSQTGITATAGIGTNMYLCKIAMDIVAKHISADKDGVRIAQLDEMSYREKLWDHKPLTDFWRIGKGYSKKLQDNGMYTMGDVARCSLINEDRLYKLFGVNAELLIDHAWGWEPCEIKDIKSYVPENNSLSQGQVLSQPYDFEGGKLICREMTDLLVLDIVKKGLVTNQVVLTVGYDINNIGASFKGKVESDHYGRVVPKSAHGSKNLSFYTSSTKLITDAMMQLYDEIVDKDLSVRRMYVVANHIIRESDIPSNDRVEQLNLFAGNIEQADTEHEKNIEKLEKEKELQKAMLSIKDKYGKNSILKGMNYEKGATAKERNEQVGGHKA